MCRRDERVSQKPSAARPQKWRMAEALHEDLVRRNRQNVLEPQVTGIESRVIVRNQLVAMARHQRRLVARQRIPVPRTDFLAHIATEKSGTDDRPALVVQKATGFDREARNAASCIESMWSDQCASGAGVHASRTAAAVGFDRVVRLEFQIGDQRPEQEPGAVPRVNEAVVAADEAQACPSRKGALEKRTSVDADARADASRRKARPYETFETAQFLTNHTMVILGECIPGNRWFSKEGIPAQVWRRLGIGKPHHQHGARAVQETARIGARRRIDGHPGPQRIESSFGERFDQAVGVFMQRFGGRDSKQMKTKFEGSLPNIFFQVETLRHFATPRSQVTVLMGRPA